MSTKRGRLHWLRENHRATCPPKIGHDTEEEAQAHIDRLVAIGRVAVGEMLIYRCLECHKLHVGHDMVVHVGTSIGR